MKNYISKGNTIIITAPAAGILSGQLVRIGKIIGVASCTASDGEQVAVHITGVYLVPKEVGVQTMKGEELYFVDAGGNVNKTAAGNTFAGYAFEDASAADTIVMLIIAH